MMKIPKDNFHSDQEREIHAIYIINLFLSNNLLSNYEYFTVFSKIFELSKEERSKALEVQTLIKTILLENEFAKNDGEFEDDIRMSERGRKLIKIGKFEDFFENTMKPPTGINFNLNVGRDIVGSTINHGSSISKSPINTTNTTPKINQKNKDIIWYSKPIFKYFIWPIVVGLITAYFIFVFKLNE